MPDAEVPARCVAIAARAAGSPSWASSVTSGAGDLAPRRQRAAERRRPGSLGAPARALARRARGPETSASRQPWFGQLPGHGGPSASMTMWPSSPAAPVAPRTSAPVDEHPAADAGADREHAPRRARRARRRSGTRRAAPRWRRCRRRPAARGARPAGRATARRRSGEVVARHRARRSPARPGTGCRRRPPRTSAARRLARLLDGLDERRSHDARRDATAGRRGGAHAGSRVDGPGEELRPSQVDADHAAVGHRPATIHRCMPEPTDTAAAPEYKRLPRPTAPARSAAATAARCSTSCAARRPGRAGRSAGAPDHRRPRRQVARARGRRLARAVARPVPRQRADPAGRGRRTRRRRSSTAAASRLTSPQTILVLGSDRAAPRAPRSPAPTRQRPEPLGLDPAAALRRRAQRASCRSRATRSSTSPATAATRSTPPTRSAAPRSRSRRSSSTSASRSTTSSWSTSRTSPTLIDAMGGIDYTGGCVVSRINGGAQERRRHAAPARRARTTSTASRRSRSPARARTRATRARTTAPAPAASRRSSRR